MIMTIVMNFTYNYIEPEEQKPYIKSEEQKPAAESKS